MALKRTVLTTHRSTRSHCPRFFPFLCVGFLNFLGFTGLSRTLTKHPTRSGVYATLMEGSQRALGQYEIAHRTLGRRTRLHGFQERDSQDGPEGDRSPSKSASVGNLCRADDGEIRVCETRAHRFKVSITRPPWLSDPKPARFTEPPTTSKPRDRSASNASSPWSYVRKELRLPYCRPSRTVSASR